MIFECEGSSGRARGVEGWIALAGARNPEACGKLLLQFILNYLCHRATWRLIIQRNYRYIQASKHAILKQLLAGASTGDVGTRSSHSGTVT